MENTNNSNSNVKSSEDHLSRGNALLNQGDYEAAIFHYDEAIRIDPNNVNAYNDRGIAKGILEQYSESISDFDTAISLVSNRENFYYNRGVSRLKLKQYFDAISDFDKAIELKIRFL